MLSPENHKAIIRWLFEDVWSKGDFDQDLYLGLLYKEDMIKLRSTKGNLGPSLAARVIRQSHRR
jgi:hypothetical protein